MEKVADYSAALHQRHRHNPAALWLAARFRQPVLDWLAGLEGGCLRLEEGGAHRHFGPSAAGEAEVVVQVRHPRCYRSLLLGGGLGAAESFVLGDWDSPDPVAVIRLMAANLDRLQALEQGMRWPARLGLAAFEWLRANTRRGARRNIAAHYDLGNAFFALFLDRDMMYSSAIYPEADSGLELASWHKREHICRQLALTADDHLLEIGTGWGGMAIHAARRYGCRVTTTTISREQYEYARARVAAEGLSDRVTVRLCDYRDLDGCYDKLVSVEMIEAVGHRFLPVYFRHCRRLLRPGGRLLLQAITIPDARYEAARRRVDFIRRYIFPGGCLPSLARLQAVTGPAWQWQGVEDITPHYARTLADWRQRFLAQLPVVRQQGFDESFIRLWHFYLAYCEGGFRERAITTHQLLLTRR